MTDYMQALREYAEHYDNFPPGRDNFIAKADVAQIYLAKGVLPTVEQTKLIQADFEDIRNAYDASKEADEDSQSHYNDFKQG